MRIKINVTNENIKNGKRVSCTKCPVALAVAEAGFRTVYVDGHYMTLGASRYQVENGNDILHSLPEKATNFVLAFDKKLPVKPFSFTVNLRKEDLETLKFAGLARKK